MRFAYRTALVSCLGLSVNSVARAACEDPPEVCAKAAFEAGIAAYQDEKFEEALSQFRAAQQLRPHPVVLFNVALAEARTGLVLEAIEHLQQVYDDPQTPENLLGKVRAERDATARRVARISLVESGAELVVDGQTAAGDPPTMDVNPGDHEVVLLVDGEEIERRTLSLAAGEKVRLVVPRPAPAAPPRPVDPPSATSPSTVTTPPQDLNPSGLSPWVVYGGAGLTIALAGVTVWSGLDTRRAFRDYEDDVDDLTVSERDDRIDSGKAKQLRTNVLLGVSTAVGLATAATAVFLVDWSDQSDRSALTVGPGCLTYRRRF